MPPLPLSRRGAGRLGLRCYTAAASRGFLGSLDLGCMLLWKVSTGSCEASRINEMRGAPRRRQVLETSEPQAADRKKRAVLLPGRLKVVAWNLIPQRPCTAVTLFAAIPAQDRQQAVDSSVTSATHWRHFRTRTSTPQGARERLAATAICLASRLSNWSGATAIRSIMSAMHVPRYNACHLLVYLHPSPSGCITDPAAAGILE
jgi:hypothetical protein